MPFKTLNNLCKFFEFTANKALFSNVFLLGIHRDSRRNPLYDQSIFLGCRKGAESVPCAGNMSSLRASRRSQEGLWR